MYFVEDQPGRPGRPSSLNTGPVKTVVRPAQESPPGEARVTHKQTHGENLVKSGGCIYFIHLHLTFVFISTLSGHPSKQ